MAVQLCVMPSKSGSPDTMVDNGNDTTLDQVFHSMLAHPGGKRSNHPENRKQVDYIHCDYCQHVKIFHKGIALIPGNNLTNTPWYKVADDLIGLWSARKEHFNGDFYALTCIETTTNLVELACIETKSSDAIAMKFENTWLAHYPWMTKFFHNNGGKIMRFAVEFLLCVLAKMFP